MDLSQLSEALAIEPPVVGNWLRQVEDKQPEEPPQRRFHSSVVHKSSLYVYGGLLRDEPDDHQGEQMYAYRFNFNSKQWSRLATHFLNNNSFSYVFGHSTAVFNNMMYLFGGKNRKDNSYLPGLWCLNLESYNWKRQELKGYSPSPRKHAAMVLHQRNSILLYGGRKGQENLNDFHIYRIDNKMWLQIEESSYDLKIPCRLKPALCSQGDHLYLFGGERIRTCESGTENVLMRDFYQLKLINRPMSSRPDVWVKEIVTNYSPTERVASFVNLGEKYLMLWGGQNAVEGRAMREPGFWLYSIPDINWVRVALNSKIRYFPLYGATVNYFAEKCYIMGQYAEIEEEVSSKEMGKVPKSTSSGLLILGLEPKQLESKLSNTNYKPRIMDQPDRQCWECNQHYSSLTSHKFSEFSILQEMLVDELSYPYSAFGLLFDNCLILTAKESRVIFNHTFKEKYILVEDNGATNKLWTTNAEFINDLLVMRTYVEENIDQLEEEVFEEEGGRRSYIPESPVHHPASIMNTKETREQKEMNEKEAKDKEMEKELKKRKRIAKECAKKRKEDRIEYSKNVKLGALRIGNRMIFISRYGTFNDCRKVFVIEKAGTSVLQSSYRAYYYVYENGALIDPNMDNARKYIDEEYKAYFKIASDRKENAHNFVFITSLRQSENEKGDLEPELKESSRHNDIFYCEKKQLETLEDGILWDSLDISLKTYLSLLYLKSDEMKISLAINEQKIVEINNSDSFEKIDALVKSERLIDLEPALDLSHCNIIEAYYNKTNSTRGRELNRKNTAFHSLNGVLFYHKNRLISRYRFSLGEISKLFRQKLKIVQQTMIMFGFIEIKKEFSVNAFKTSFVRDDLLEQIYHRLKFVEKYAQKLTKDSAKEDGKRPPEEKPEPRKRFRGNEDGKDEAQGIQLD